MNFDSVKNNTSKIPTPFSRSASFRLSPGKTVSSPASPALARHDDMTSSGLRNQQKGFVISTYNKFKGCSRNFLDDDLESIGSVASNFSTTTTNSTCEHAHFAKNGTTYSGKSHKYIVHCSSSFNDAEEYLTPTQRANRNIKKLKSLLQLAKEKLREKEKEIFMLNKEVVELKLFKAAAETSNDSLLSPDKDPLQISTTDKGDLDNSEGSLQNSRFGELSPIKNQSGIKIPVEFLSEGPEDKIRRTPDYFLSSLADSGNFEDLTSSASFHSKDSIGFLSTPEPKQETSSFFGNFRNSDEEEKIRIVRLYEKKLGEKKAEYEEELNRIIDDQQQKNLNIIQEFEKKLKEEELKFEARWNELLKATEEEKVMIINRFEEKLEEERKKYKESLNVFKSTGENVTEMVCDTTYSKKVEEEKTMYENSLSDIKQKFESEKSSIVEKFDDAMRNERLKFEESLKSIKDIGEREVADLSKKIAGLEAELLDLLPKYDRAKSRNEELEKENEELRNSLKEQEQIRRKMYMEYGKKQQEESSQGESCPENTCTVSVPELFTQLKITEVELENLKDKEYRAAHSGSEGLCFLSFKEAISLWMLAARKAMYKRLAEAQAKSAAKEKSEHDPEATLQFLKSAVYYFLTDRENHLEHLKAIESILAYSPTEKENIEKIYLNKY